MSRYDVPKNKMVFAFYVCFHADLYCNFGEVTFYLHWGYILWGAFGQERKNTFLFFVKPEFKSLT